jgi:phage repressor protein C with HTH and peptisase S24 domain
MLYTTIDRIRQFIQHKGLSMREFSKVVGVSHSLISKTNAIGSDKLESILSSYPELSPKWLLTGQGEMLAVQEQEENVPVLAAANRVYGLRTDHLVGAQSVPLYNLEATAGIVELFRHAHDEKPVDFISIPNLPKCDGAIYVTGDSMYPLLKSGDIVMYKQIQEIKDGIFWGEMYLISIQLDGEEYVSVKWVQKSELGEQYIKLVSENRHHQPKDIPLNKVRALALVKASIRINSMN